MTEELDYETLERFAMAVESWPKVLADEEYQRMVDEEIERRSSLNAERRTTES